MLWNEIGMLPQAIACALDLDDADTVHKAIELGDGDDAIAEYLRPIRRSRDWMSGVSHRVATDSRPMANAQRS